MKLGNNWLAPLLVLVLLGGTASLVLFTTSAQVGPRDAIGATAAPIASEETLRALLEELGALRGEISELRLAAAWTSQPSERRESDPVLAQESRDAALESIRAENAPIGTAAEPNVPRPPAERTLLHREALDRLGPAGEDASRDHLFWSYQRVLDTYGPPDQIHPTQEGGLTWLYARGEEGRDAGFAFFDGFVVRVWG